MTQKRSTHVVLAVSTTSFPKRYLGTTLHRWYKHCSVGDL